jgi:hypothetical protein
MSFNYSPWFYDYQTFFPIGENAFHENEKEPIPIIYLEFLVGSAKDFELLPKKDNFKL